MFLLPRLYYPAPAAPQTPQGLFYILFTVGGGNAGVKVRKVKLKISLSKPSPRGRGTTKWWMRSAQTYKVCTDIRRAKMHRLVPREASYSVKYLKTYPKKYAFCREKPYAKVHTLCVSSPEFYSDCSPHPPLARSPFPEGKAKVRRIISSKTIDILRLRSYKSQKTKAKTPVKVHRVTLYRRPLPPFP